MDDSREGIIHMATHFRFTCILDGYVGPIGGVGGAEVEDQ